MFSMAHSQEDLCLRLLDTNNTTVDLTVVSDAVHAMMKNQLHTTATSPRYTTHKIKKERPNEAAT
jgi:hypothetical protein